MICWFLLVPAGVLVLVSLLLSSLVSVLVSLLSSFFPQDRGSVPLYHYDLLVPPGSGWGSGACLPYSLFFRSGACLPSSLFFLSSGKGFCSIMICWFLLVPAGVPVLVSLFLSSLVPVLVSLLLSSWSCSIMICWFSLVPDGFRCLSSLLLSSLVPVLVSLLLSSFFLGKGVLFHHDLLVPPGSGSGSGVCLPSSLFFFFLGKGFYSIMIYWFLLVPAGFRCLSPFFSLFSYLRKGVLFHHDLLVPLGSGWVSGACPCLPSSLCFLSSGQGFCSIMDLLVPPASGWGSGACLPSSPFFWLFGVYAGVICLR